MPEFKKSTRKNKKYSVITPKGKTIHFGAIVAGKPMEQYKDSTGLGLYSKYDHGNNQRRKSYILRAKGIKNKDDKLTWKNKESANYYSVKFLW
jgi:hypothetical protein